MGGERRRNVGGRQTMSVVTIAAASYIARHGHTIDPIDT
jgi:hypothetical protein